MVEENELFELALKISMENGTMKANYMRGIYANFKKYGIKTIEDYTRHEQERTQRKKRDNAPGKTADVDAGAAERLREINRRKRDLRGLH